MNIISIFKTNTVRHSVCTSMGLVKSLLLTSDHERILKMSKIVALFWDLYGHFEKCFYLKDFLKVSSNICMDFIF